MVSTIQPLWTAGTGVGRLMDGELELHGGLSSAIAAAPRASEDDLDSLDEDDFDDDFDDDFEEDSDDLEEDLDEDLDEEEPEDEDGFDDDLDEDELDEEP